MARHELSLRRWSNGALVLVCLLLFGLTHLNSWGSRRAAAAPVPKSAAGKGSSTPAKLTTLQTPYHIIYSDLTGEALQEAALRMTRMAEEYHNRTKTFSGVIREKLPFYLFKREEDYYAAGGPPGTVGVFMVRGMDQRLMAIAGEETSDETWHTIQHEGFHQFAYAVIGELPTWANEGLAEYFGEGIWTGDGYVTGIAPPLRCKVIQLGIAKKAFMPLPQMMALSLDDWNAQMSGANYHQAWAMCHFLAHAEGGKYQDAFSNFIRNINRRVPAVNAWQQSFGTTEGFERVWTKWWTELEPDPTPERYTRATLGTLTSYLARSHQIQKSFRSVEEMTKAIEAGSTKFTGTAWLPDSLFRRAAKRVGRDKTVFTLKPAVALAPPYLIAERPDGTKYTATFPAKVTYPVKINVEVDDLVPAINEATALLEGGKKAEAKALLQTAIKRNGRSATLEQAKQLLVKMR